ncbi:MAG: hypothetical protein ACQESF_02355 [Nanobdellota archaeon]
MKFSEGKLEGRIVSLQPYDIEVEITNPYQGITMGLHIPTFARGVTPDYGKCKPTEHGKATAKDMLFELYDICRYAESESFQKNLKDYKEELNRLIPPLKQASGKEYHEEKKWYEDEHKRLFNEFSERLSLIIPYDTLEQLTEKGVKKSLGSK